MRMLQKEKGWPISVVAQACTPSQLPTSTHCKYIFTMITFSYRSVTGFDIDTDALNIAQDNLLELDCADRVDLVLGDILQLQKSNQLKGYFDTVVMNPPFGTKNNEGVDVNLLSAAIDVFISFPYCDIDVLRKSVQFA